MRDKEEYCLNELSAMASFIFRISAVMLGFIVLPIFCQAHHLLAFAGEIAGT